MTLILIEFVIVLIGFAATAVLFYRFPKLPEAGTDDKRFPAVSVIIPARNEEKNIALLLGDLRSQSLSPLEIICVDDSSKDATAQVASAYGARVISLDNKPEGWTGKAWACQNGADAAQGELLLFLDADVRLGRNGVLRLVQEFANSGCTISVQPYHKTEKVCEQLSMLFNLVQIAANGIAMPKERSIGLYGPVILIARSDYIKVGGHKSVRKSIVEDIALGLRLKGEGLSYRLFVGDEEIAFRMYGGGLRSLLQGWVKNIASGAVKTPPPVFVMVFFWLASLASVPLQMVKMAAWSQLIWFAIYSGLYVSWAIILSFLSRRIGRFKFWDAIFFPILVIAFFGVVIVSVISKVFGLKVRWKGRAIVAEEKPCE